MSDVLTCSRMSRLACPSCCSGTWVGPALPDALSYLDCGHLGCLCGSDSRRQLRVSLRTGCSRSRGAESDRGRSHCRRYPKRISRAHW